MRKLLQLEMRAGKLAVFSSKAARFILHVNLAPCAWAPFTGQGLQSCISPAQKKDAADIGFDDAFIYQEIDLPFEKRQIQTTQLMREDALTTFREWEEKEDKISY